jgi:hypothetical protein
MSGFLTYGNGAHRLTFSGMGNLGQTAFQTLATPVQNNGAMYALIYTYSKDQWIVQPYLQYSDVPTNPAIGVMKGTSATGGALLVTRKLRRGSSLAGRGEYVSTSGSTADGNVNLMYGPGSAAWSVTLTPAFQYDRFFIRADLAFVRANRHTPGSAFGPDGASRNQPRGVIEAGFLF